MFHVADDALLKNLEEDGEIIEPEWYVPVIPLVLVNGADGIGTGKYLSLLQELLVDPAPRLVDVHTQL